MSESISHIKRYNCGKVAIVRNDKPIDSKQQKRCFGYKRGKCSALKELLCENGGQCSFWKERTLESSIVCT